MDDILIWGSTLSELEERIEIIAQNCARLNIIPSKKKFAIGTSMPFAGYIVNSQGVTPDPSRVEAIKNFPPPQGSNCFALLCRHGSTAGIFLFFPHNYCYA